MKLLDTPDSLKLLEEVSMKWVDGQIANKNLNATEVDPMH